MEEMTPNNKKMILENNYEGMCSFNFFASYDCFEYGLRIDLFHQYIVLSYLSGCNIENGSQTIPTFRAASEPMQGSNIQKGSLVEV